MGQEKGDKEGQTAFPQPCPGWRDRGNAVATDAGRGPRPLQTICYDLVATKPLSSRGDIILCDLREYLIAHKESRQTTSMHVKFVDDEQAFRITWRWDGMSEGFVAYLLSLRTLGMPEE